MVYAEVYAEVAAGFDTIEPLDEALPVEVFRREPLPYHARFLPCRASTTYRKNNRTKQSPLPDFYFGTHAAVSGYRVLGTRAVRRLLPDRVAHHSGRHGLRAGVGQPLSYGRTSAVRAGLCSSA
jgi:hypothetical protein